MNLKSKIALSIKVLCTLCMVFLGSAAVFAQKIDTSKISIKPKPRVVSKIPQIKANITPYKPNTYNYSTTSNVVNNTALTKTGKILTILKIYPNPVSDQINISLRLDREIMLSIKITDVLGNDIAVLANERTSAGEQTKTYTIPDKISPGIYFLRIVAGGEPVVRKISVF